MGMVLGRVGSVMQNSKPSVYLHVGLPKNLSSSLQKHFFPKHPDIYHLGVGNGETLIDYADDELNVLFENYMMYSRDFEYTAQTKRFQNLVGRHISHAAAKGKKCVTVSLELLSFTFTPDMIDITQKISRLNGLFEPYDTKVLLILRNQKQLIKSMYREFVKVGYDKSFNEYIEYLYVNRSRSFIFDLMYYELVEAYAQRFGKENVDILVIENFKGPSGELDSGGKGLLLEALCQKLNVKNHCIDLGHENEALSRRVLGQKLRLNKVSKHDLSNSLFGGANKHRLYTYFASELGVKPQDPFSDVKVKRQLIREAKILGAAIPEEIDYICDRAFAKEILSMLSDSNKRLALEYDINLPDSYFDEEF